MRIRLALLSVALLVWLLYSGNAESGAKTAVDKSRSVAKTSPGYAFTLESYAPDVYQVLVSPVGIRVDIVGAHCTVVSKAPDWNIYAWRDQDKTIFTTPHVRWCKNCQLQQFNWTADLKLPKKTVAAQFRNMPAFFYTFEPAEKAGIFIQSSFGKSDNSSVEKEPLAICLDFGKSFKGGSVMSRLLGMPCLAGVPVQLTKGRRLDPAQTYLFIKSMTKINVSKSAFEPPKNYKAVPFSEAFFQSKTRSSNINDLFETYSK